MAHYSKIPYCEGTDYQGFVFMAQRSFPKKNVKQKEVIEEIFSDDESSVEGEIDCEKELIVAIDYLNKEVKKRKETAKLLKQTERQVVELKEQLSNAENLLNEKDECLLDKLKEVEYLKSLDTACETSMDYAKHLKISEN